jgi:hypothetical protein
MMSLYGGMTSSRTKGCGGGRFDLLYASRHPEKNVLAVDIRAPLVERGSVRSSLLDMNTTVFAGKDALLPPTLFRACGCIRAMIQ